jgi:hypothetical protein
MANPVSFNEFQLPGGRRAWVPADLDLKRPEASRLPVERQHALIYLPWHDRYLDLVPLTCRDFFKFVLPYLRARTTDVHVATCLPFVKLLGAALGAAPSAAQPGPIDEAVVTIAFILHDSGWSQMTEAEIADSLDVQGLALTAAAASPKARHAALGKAVAERVLAGYAFQPPLSATELDWIYTAILYHDKPWELAAGGDIPLSVKLVCDVDHLWSFTRANFWQDTVRKQESPEVYAAALARDLDGYFVTEAGRAQARLLLAERGREAADWARLPPLYNEGR